MKPKKIIDKSARKGVTENKKEIDDLKKRITELEKTRDTQIIDDLTKTKPGMDTYMFSYREIAQRHGVSTAKIQKIANENDLNRK